LQGRSLFAYIGIPIQGEIYCPNTLPSASVQPPITSQNAVVTMTDAIPLPEDPYLGYHLIQRDIDLR
jgi:hypothetical protein